MLKRFNQVIYSNKEPVNKNDIWIDDDNIIRIYKNGDWEAISGGEGGIGKVDTKMSNTSSNPVANKTIKEYVDLHPQYERIDEIEAPEIDLGGGGTTAAGIQALEVRYNLDGSELTDEDKAVNAATYATVATGGDCILYWSMGATTVYCSVVNAPTEDNPILGVSIETLLFSLLGSSSVMLSINPDGSIAGGISIGGNKLLELGNITTYEELYAKLAEAGLINTQIIGPILITGMIKGVEVDGYITLGVSDESAINLVITTVYGTNIFVYSTTENLFVDVYNRGYIYINSTAESYLANNIAVVSDAYSNTKLSTFDVVDNDNNTYSVINGSLSNNVATIVIYRNNTFETWQINSDGTTQQIS